MTGKDLHELLLEKWGVSYDLQIRKIKGRVFLQVMWKYLEQASFPLSEEEYFERLDTVANYLNAWGTMAQIKACLDQSKEKPRIGKVVNIPIELGDRASEWILEE